MKNDVKKAWGLTALQECERQAIEGGYVEPTISNSDYERPKVIAAPIIIFWNS